MTDGIKTGVSLGKAGGVAPVAEFPEPAADLAKDSEAGRRAASGSREKPDRPGWVETPSSQRISSALACAQRFGDIAVVHGGTGVGKTAAARRYASESRGVCIARMSPAEERLLPCLKQVARACGAESWGRDVAYLYHRVSRHLGGRWGLLIIDEAQHLGHSPLEALRGLHDETGCGLALLGNDHFGSRIKRPEFAALASRAVGNRVYLPRATSGDVDAILDAWGIEAAKARERGHGRAAPPAGVRGLVKALERGMITGAKAPNSRKGQGAQGGAA